MRWSSCVSQMFTQLPAHKEPHTSKHHACAPSNTLFPPRWISVRSDCQPSTCVHFLSWPSKALEKDLTGWFCFLMENSLFPLSLFFLGPVFGSLTVISAVAFHSLLLKAGHILGLEEVGLPFGAEIGKITFIHWPLVFAIQDDFSFSWH